MVPVLQVLPPPRKCLALRLSRLQADAAISRGHNLFLIPMLSVVINPVMFRKLFLLDWMIHDCPRPYPVLAYTALAAAHCSGERTGISSSSGLLQDGY